MAENVKQVYDSNPSTTAGNNDLFYLGKSPYAVTDDSAIKYSDLFTQLAGSFVQTLGGVTEGHLTVYGSNAQSIKDCGIAVDTNQNIYPNNSAPRFRTTATSGGTTTLTVADTYNQFFTGTLTHTVVLPVTSTLTTGFSFYIVNLSTKNVTVNSSGGNTVHVMAPTSTAYITCKLTSGTTAASWYVDATGVGTDLLPNGMVIVTDPTQTIASGTNYIAEGAGIVTFTLPSPVFNTYFAITGINGWRLNIGSGESVTIGHTTISGPTNYWLSSNNSDTVIFQCNTSNSWQSISLSGNPVTNGGVPAMPIPGTTGSSGQLSQSTGTSAPGWTTATYPSTAGTSGNVVMSDGTNFNSTALAVLFPNGTENVTGTTKTIVPGTLYFANNASQVVFTLPTTFTTALNQSFGIIGRGAGGWRIVCNSGQQMQIGSRACTATTGYFQSNQLNNAVMFQAVSTNTLYQAFSVVGNISNDLSQIANAIDCAFTANQLLYSSSAGNLAGLATAADSFLQTNGSGVPSLQNASTTRTNLAVPGLATNNAFTAQNGITPVAITSSGAAIAWDLNSAPNATHTATENTTLGSASNQVAGNIYTLKFVQHASSAKTFAWNANYKFPQGVVPVVSTGLSAVDVFTFYSDGTNMRCIGIAQNIS